MAFPTNYTYTFDFITRYDETVAAAYTGLDAGLRTQLQNAVVNLTNINAAHPGISCISTVITYNTLKFRVCYYATQEKYNIIKGL
jgi:hypothetical protein